MGCKSGSCKEKEWQSVPQGQLDAPKDGIYPIEGSRVP
jgi:hypothetical protein